MYNLFITNSAEKDFDKILEPFFSKILSGIDNLAVNPRNFNVKKLIGKQNQYRLRVGNYRVLFSIDENNKNIRIARILHRKEAYKK